MFSPPCEVTRERSPITLGMTGDVLQSVWLILALLAYVLITCVFTVLSYSRKRAIDIHDRVRECMAIRHKYLEDLNRRNQAK